MELIEVIKTNPRMGIVFMVILLMAVFYGIARSGRGRNVAHGARTAAGEMFDESFIGSAFWIVVLIVVVGAALGIFGG